MVVGAHPRNWAVFFSIAAFASVSNAYSVKSLGPAKTGCMKRVDLDAAKAAIERFHLKTKNATNEEIKAFGTSLIWIERLNGGKPLKEAVPTSSEPYAFHFMSGFGASRRLPSETQITRNGGKNYGENMAQLVHELGHSVGHGGGYDEYERVMDGKRCIVSSYSAGAFNEQFAEVFAAFVTYPKLMKEQGTKGCNAAYEYFSKTMFANGDLAGKCIEHAPVKDADAEIQADAAAAARFDDLCEQFKERITAVDAAVEKKLPAKTHPETLPADLFANDDSLWSQYSTPSRDARLRLAVAETIKSAVSFYRRAKAGNESLKFKGDAQAFADSLRAKLAASSKACSIQYKNSADAKVKLSLNEAIARLDKMAFDPYLCPEKRWGASSEEEMKSCLDKDADKKWYDGEKFMRNVVGKTDGKGVALLRSDRPVTLPMLTDSALIDQPSSAKVNLGTATPPILSLEKNFASPKFIELLKKTN